MNHDHYPDGYISAILNRVKTMAFVGGSANAVRPSYFAMKYLQQKGYRIIPVNPGQAGKTILGETVYAQLKDIPLTVDMVDIFRNSEAAGPITDEAIEAGIKVIWMQLGVRNDAAASRAEAAGAKVVMDRCPKIEYGRLSGEISWSGVNTRRISAKRPKLQSGFQHLGINRGRQT